MSGPVSSGGCPLAAFPESRDEHVYPLGGLKKSARWTRAVIDGRFEMREDGQGFEVDYEHDWRLANRSDLVGRPAARSAAEVKSPIAKSVDDLLASAA